MKLSYSEYNVYKKCPKRYYNEVNKVEPPEPQSSYFAAYGLLIESFFKFYVNTLLKKNIILDDDQTESVLRKLWDKVLKENYIKWDDPWCRESSSHIFMSVLEDIKTNINTFDFWQHAQSEVSFNIFLKKSQDTLTCRLDFIVNNPDGTVEILDGKGTYKMDKTIDIEQLYFYILVYYMHYKKLPDKAGFLYYKFHLVKYIDFDINIINDFSKKLALVKRAIREDKKFEAQVGISKQCKWCAYRMTCEELIVKRREWSEKRKKATPFEFTGDMINFVSEGINDEGSN